MVWPETMHVLKCLQKAFFRCLLATIYWSAYLAIADVLLDTYFLILYTKGLILNSVLL